MESFAAELRKQHGEHISMLLARIAGDLEKAARAESLTYQWLARFEHPEYLIFPTAVLERAAIYFAQREVNPELAEDRELMLLPEWVGQREPADVASRRTRVSTAMTEILATMPLRLREAYVLAYMRRQPRVAIATRLGITTKELSKRLREANRRCQRDLLNHGIDLSRLEWL